MHLGIPETAGRRRPHMEPGRYALRYGSPPPRSARVRTNLPSLTSAAVPIVPLQCIAQLLRGRWVMEGRPLRGTSRPQTAGKPPDRVEYLIGWLASGVPDRRNDIVSTFSPR